MSDLPDVRFGNAEAPLPNDWQSVSDPETDDELLPETPQDVIDMLGFDPAKEPGFDMPLEPGSSESVIQHNIREMRHSGHSEAQSVAAAEHNADKYRGDGMDSAKLDAVAGAVEKLDSRLDAMEKRRADAGDEPGNGREPYGDVKYADPGYQSDKQERYPIDTDEHIRAAWNYIHKHRDEDKYTPEQRKEIEGRILRAWKEKIGGSPPEAEKDD